MHEFGRWIGQETFEDVVKETDPTKQVEVLNVKLARKVEEICPTKKVKIFMNDKEFMNEKLQTI